MGGAMTKLALKAIVHQLWTAYCETSDPRTRKMYADLYCRTKEVYLDLHGEPGDSEV